LQGIIVLVKLEAGFGLVSKHYILSVLC